MYSINKIFNQVARVSLMLTICIIITITNKSQAIAANYNKSYKKSDSSISELEKMRAGFILSSGAIRTGCLGVFFEYQPIKYYGFRLSLEGGTTETFLVPKGLDTKFFKKSSSYQKIGAISSEAGYDTKEELGYYKFNIFRIPIEARLYPWQGDFAFSFGINFEILIDQSELTISGFAQKIRDNEITIDDLPKNSSDSFATEFEFLRLFNDHCDEVAFEKKNRQNEGFFSKLRIRLFTGFSYTSSYGIIFGMKAYINHPTFINYNEKYCDILFTTKELAEFSIGLDIMKIINYKS